MILQVGVLIGVIGYPNLGGTPGKYLLVLKNHYPSSLIIKAHLSTAILSMN